VLFTGYYLVWATEGDEVVCLTLVRVVLTCPSCDGFVLFAL
jgi:hypothetical protein